MNTKYNKKKIEYNKKKNEYQISSSDLISMLGEKTHSFGYFHHTIWSYLRKMMEPVVVSEDEPPHRMLHIGAAVNMNDEYDKNCGKGVYFTSFLFGPTEAISMWANYGVPNIEAVRIKIDEKEILEWANDFKEGKVKVYGVNSDGSLTLLEDEPRLVLANVAYWNNTNDNDHNAGIFSYDGKKYRLNDNKDVEQLMTEHPYFFKKFAWSYERETRLVLIFDKDLADQYKRVAVPFDKPFELIDKKFSQYVMQGPWFSPQKPRTKAAGHSLSEAKPSSYKGSVSMRSACDICSMKNKKECKCPYKKKDKDD